MAEWGDGSKKEMAKERINFSPARPSSSSSHTQLALL
jgi:hypothetical protein